MVDALSASYLGTSPEVGGFKLDSFWKELLPSLPTANPP